MADKLIEMIEDATDSDLTDGGRYFLETSHNLTECGHGDVGEFTDPSDGRLVEYLWNNRKAIAALTAERDALREALEELLRMNEHLALWAAKQRNGYHFEAVQIASDNARAALKGDPANG